MKHASAYQALGKAGPAAFRRLCVETAYGATAHVRPIPAAFRRLCVETQPFIPNTHILSQPPSGGCVLKHAGISLFIQTANQPPSGGCVLKPMLRAALGTARLPAAFRRLCVETSDSRRRPAGLPQPPSGGCVLKLSKNTVKNMEATQPPSGGCVLKQNHVNNHSSLASQPPSGGCVLKLCLPPASCGTPPPAAFGRLRVETFMLLPKQCVNHPAAFGRLRVETSTA